MFEHIAGTGIVEGVNAAVVIVTSIVTLAGYAVAIYKSIKAKQFSAALETSENALGTVVAGIEAYEQIEKVRGVNNTNSRILKETIQQIANQTGAEKERLASAVEQIAKLIGDSRMRNTCDPSEVKARAVIAVQKARLVRELGGKPEAAPTVADAPAPGASGVPPLLMLFVAGLSALVISACCQQRMTDETFVVTREGGTALVIEWPPGVDASDVVTVDVEGRAESVALVESAPPERIIKAQK